MSRKFGFQDRIKVRLSPQARKFDQSVRTAIRSSGGVISMLTEAPHVVARRKEAKMLAALKDAKRERQHQAALANPTSKRLRRFLNREEKKSAKKEGRRPLSQIERHARRMLNCPTQAERYVTRALKSIGIKFQCQHIVGNRILDFYLPHHDIAIEADGSQHFTDEGLADDALREKQVNAKYPGIKFIRLSNDAILNSRRLSNDIRARIQAIEAARGTHVEIILDGGRVERYRIA